MLLLQLPLPLTVTELCLTQCMFPALAGQRMLYVTVSCHLPGDAADICSRPVVKSQFSEPQRPQLIILLLD